MASSSDEGEITENKVSDLKATSLSKKLEGSGVDRKDRQRETLSGPRSPEYDGPLSRASRRSRSPRGLKRPRDERDHGTDRERDDPRRFRIHFEDSDRGADSYRRSRVAYDDAEPSLHRGSRGRDSRSQERGHERNGRSSRDTMPGGRRGQNLGGRPYDDRNGDRDDRRRQTSPRSMRFDGSARPGGQDRSGYPDRSRNGGAPARAEETTRSELSSRDNAVRDPTKTAETQPESSSNGQTDTPDEDFEEPTVIDEDAEIERRRKRRAELLAKSSSANPLLLTAVHAAAGASRDSSPAPIQQTATAAQDGLGSDTGTLIQLSPLKPADKPGVGSMGLGTPYSQGEGSPALDIVDETDLVNRHAVQNADDDGPSAADYDPSLDMKADGIRDEMRHGHVGLHGEVLPDAPAEKNNTEEPAAEEKAGDDDDDDFDMFADDFDEEKYTAPKQSEAAVVVADKAAPALGPPAGGILEGDDREGYYKIRIGEVLNGRYQVQSTLGKGMFSGVFRAIDSQTKRVVAIKIMRNNDALRKGGYVEINILQKLNSADPEGRKHIVKFEHHFDHKGHLCMVFENLSLNLREVLRKFGNNVGINLGATRAYAYQIFAGLAHMRRCSIIHADLKPDNILVNESRSTLKICDLGTGIDRSDAATAHNDVTPYLVSRFYRAPEIILGMPYDYAIDVWSIGCTLYELYTGKILFTGDSNNQMLKAIMEIRGRFTPKLFKRGQLSGAHFDDLGNFISVETDKVLGKVRCTRLSCSGSC